MNVSRNEPTKQIKHVISKYESAVAGTYVDRLSATTLMELLTSMITTLERLAPKETYYFGLAQAVMQNPSLSDHERLSTLLGVIKSLEDAYRHGYLQKIEGLIRADVFSDFLDMAEYLLRENYKDAAAVMIGGVLEQHLRRLCEERSLGTATAKGDPKKADAMNNELAPSGAYNKLDQKHVTAWLDLRNKAAHGKYDEYTVEHVELVCKGVRGFVERLSG